MKTEVLQKAKELEKEILNITASLCRLKALKNEVVRGSGFYIMSDSCVSLGSGKLTDIILTITETQLNDDLKALQAELDKL